MSNAVPFAVKNSEKMKIISTAVNVAVLILTTLLSSPAPHRKCMRCES